MRSIPMMARKADRQRLSPIRGTVPSAADRPVGCAFTSRCPFAFAPCATTQPGRTGVGSGHIARCHLLSQETADVEEPA